MAWHAEFGILRTTHFWWKAVENKASKLSRSRLERFPLRQTTVRHSNVTCFAFVNHSCGCSVKARVKGV